MIFTDNGKAEILSKLCYHCDQSYCTMRPDWDSYFMKLLIQYPAQHLHAPLWAVLVRDKRI